MFLIILLNHQVCEPILSKLNIAKGKYINHLLFYKKYITKNPRASA